ncbi:MAG: hypothetical protein ABGX25_06605 [Nautiliaceae bacterium]
MKTIEIKVSDSKLKKVLMLLESLKGEIINQFQVKEIDKDFEEVKKELELLKKTGKSPKNAREFLNEL